MNCKKPFLECPKLNHKNEGELFLGGLVCKSEINCPHSDEPTNTTKTIVAGPDQDGRWYEIENKNYHE